MFEFFMTLGFICFFGVFIFILAIMFAERSENIPIYFLGIFFCLLFGIMFVVGSEQFLQIDTIKEEIPIEFIKRTPDGVINVYGNGVCVRSELASHYIASSNNLAIMRYKKVRNNTVLSYSNVLELK